VKARIVAAALLVLAARSARASFTASANGTTTADFLNLGVGARAVAMGGAFSAAADDATALYWNPAAMTNVRGRSATLMHAAYVASSYFDYAAYAQDLGRAGAFGAGLQYFSLGTLDETDASGASAGTTSPYDLAFSLGYAYRFAGERDLGEDRDGWSAGLAAKFIQQKIVTSKSGYAADLGLLSPGFRGGKLHLAAAVQNLGANVKFDQQSDPLPLTVKLGSAYKLNRRWLGTLDVSAPRGGRPFAGLGTEYELVDGQESPWTLAVRGGYNSQTLSSITGLSGLSMGFGLGYRGGSFDYAFVPLGGLGQAHRLSLNLKF